MIGKYGKILENMEKPRKHGFLDFPGRFWGPGGIPEASQSLWDPSCMNISPNGAIWTCFGSIFMIFLPNLAFSNLHNLYICFIEIIYICCIRTAQCLCGTITALKILIIPHQRHACLTKLSPWAQGGKKRHCPFGGAGTLAEQRYKRVVRTKV